MRAGWAAAAVGQAEEGSVTALDVATSFLVDGAQVLDATGGFTPTRLRVVDGTVLDAHRAPPAARGGPQRGGDAARGDAELCGVGHRLGTLGPGHRFDAVALTASPADLADLADLATGRTIARVHRAGRPVAARPPLTEPTSAHPGTDRLP